MDTVHSTIGHQQRHNLTNWTVKQQKTNKKKTVSIGHSEITQNDKKRKMTLSLDMLYRGTITKKQNDIVFYRLIE